MTNPDSGPGAPQRPRRISLIAAVGWVAALALAVFIGLVLHYVQESNDRLSDGQKAQETVIARLSTSLDTTRQQLQQHGVTPSAPPAQSIVKGVPGVPGAAGAQGIQGVPGVQGVQGEPGVPGSPGPVSTVPGPAGSPGVAGAQGVPGVAGTNGKDGAPGKDGTNGINGTNGRDGADGKPPVSWTWTDPTGVSYTCTQVDGFDPSAPRYTCSADQPAPPTTQSSTRKGLLGVLALGSASVYRRLP